MLFNGKDSGAFFGNRSRYSWYDKKRVRDYSRFIDVRHYISMLSGGMFRYDIDPNFWVLSSDNIPHVLPSVSTPMTGNPDEDIDMGMVDIVADELAATTIRLRELRERLKLQTRKNYMRGTNNLVILAINEYLRDYSKYGRFQDGIGVRAAMRAASLKDVEIREYYDHTEYFNISCDTSISSMTGTRDVS